nr:MAG TPA: hypothetical protein [Bacteriophage sp.]
MLQGLFLIRSLHFELSTYRVLDKRRMKLFQAVGEKHSVKISFAFFSRLKYQSLPVPLAQSVVLGICRNGLLGEGVILPPSDEGRDGRDACRDQLLHGSALNGQRTLAHGAQQLIGKRQQQNSSSCNGTRSNVEVHSVSSFRVHVFQGQSPDDPGL